MCGPAKIAMHVLACIFLACSLAVVLSENGITSKRYVKQEVCQMPNNKLVLLRSVYICAVTCMRRFTCKGFDYDKSSKICRLTETGDDDLTCDPNNKSLTRYNIYIPAGKKHAFAVLKTAVTTYNGYEFLALKLKLPADGQSKNENWCRDYQMLCAGYNRRPTGCGPQHALREERPDTCAIEYNSDADISKDDDVFGILNCNPSSGVADAVNGAFGGSEAVAYNNAFAFFGCDSDNCNKDFSLSIIALSNARLAMNGDRIAFTVCR